MIALENSICSFDFDADYVLENKNVLLRPLVAEDMEHLLVFSENEPELWRYSLIQGGGKENLKKYLKLAISGRKNKKEYPFIVFDKIANAYAGSTRFYDIDLYHKTLSLGYTWYGKDFQGTGLNKNCKYLLLEFAFNTRGFERIEFRADNLNIRSIAAMKSIGCKEEGVLRSNCVSPGGRRDSIVLSILRNEWEGNVADMLLDKIKE
ncbi:Acetyltransferase [Constantimarinum furrinae]|uniref:Acetyltransferase n=1 Tax=Constantimarinum furrinae TaxID=2562285 RepID=A0A7G8PWE5_9FLAO|nr:Acetyltransferase [Constantimarinum furrinae]